MSSEPLAVAKFRNVTSPLSASRKPAAIVVLLNVCARPVVLISTTALTERFSPNVPPNSPSEGAKRATRPWALMRKPLSLTETEPSTPSVIEALTTISMPVRAIVSLNSPEIVSGPNFRSPASLSEKPLVTVIVSVTTFGRFCASRSKPSKNSTPRTMRFLILNVSIVCSLANVLISSRIWPVRLTPPMLPASERARKMRPTTPVLVAPA